MAKIEMDISEYEAMKENKLLLEKALEKEEKLNQQIIDLKQEKIDVLKNNEKKVVKVLNRRTQQILLTKKPDVVIMQELHNMFYNLNNQNVSGYGYNPKSLVERLQDAFFQVTDTTSILDDEITVHGLDEVRGEIRSEVEKTVEKEVNRLKNSVEQMKRTEESNASDLLKVDKLKSEVNTLKKDIESLENTNLTLNDAMEDFDLLEKNIGKAIEELKNDSLFTRGQTIKNAITILKTTNEGKGKS